MATLAFTNPVQIPGSSDGQVLYSTAVSPTGRYVAVGYDVTGYPIYTTSTNGSTWSTPTVIDNNLTVLYSVVFDSISGAFVAVGNDGTGNAIFTRSTNGVSWSTPASMGTPTITSMTSVTVDSAGFFMAIGGPGVHPDNYTRANSSPNPMYSTSTDGLTWTTPAKMGTGTISVSMLAVTVNNTTGKFVAVGCDDNTGVGGYAPVSAIYDKVLGWSTPQLTSTINPGILGSITVNSAGRYVAVGRDNVTYYPRYVTSTDGITWTEPTLFNGYSAGAGMHSVTVNSSGRFVAVGLANNGSSTGPVFTTSTDGLEWTTPTVINNLSFTTLTSIISYSGNFMAVGNKNLDDTTVPVFSIGTMSSPTVPCFKEGSKILCQVDGNDVYLPIEQMKPGTLVKTSMDGYKEVKLIGKRPILNPGHDERSQTRLYKCSPSNYPELNEDLYITGCHSILVKSLTDTQREGVIKNLTRVFVTGNKYRLIACVDERAEPWVSEETYNVWHFALENESNVTNYGVYANGLLVESASIRCMVERSKMEFQ